MQYMPYRGKFTNQTSVTSYFKDVSSQTRHMLNVVSTVLPPNRCPKISPQHVFEIHAHIVTKQSFSEEPAYFKDAFDWCIVMASSK